VGEVSPLTELYERYRDKGFEFLTIYVREPHPGEHYHEHRSWEEKVAYARDCREQDGIRNPLLVDDMTGTVHRTYGEMPNMVCVVAKDGRIVYRSMWTDHVEIESVLDGLVRLDEATEQGIRLRPSYTEKLSFGGGYGRAISAKVLARAGPKAAFDMEAAFSRRSSTGIAFAR
jgi:hypothetical protein